MNDKVKAAIRTVLFRENGKTTISNMLITLRIMGHTHLGSAEEFAANCKAEGFLIEYQYKRNDPNHSGKPTRTFIILPETESNNVQTSIAVPQCW